MNDHSYFSNVTFIAMLQYVIKSIELAHIRTEKKLPQIGYVCCTRLLKDLLRYVPSISLTPTERLKLELRGSNWLPYIGNHLRKKIFVNSLWFSHLRENVHDFLL